MKYYTTNVGPHWRLCTLRGMQVANRGQVTDDQVRSVQEREPVEQPFPLKLGLRKG